MKPQTQEHSKKDSRYLTSNKKLTSFYRCTWSTTKKWPSTQNVRVNSCHKIKPTKRDIHKTFLATISQKAVGAIWMSFKWRHPIYFIWRCTVPPLEKKLHATHYFQSKHTLQLKSRRGAATRKIQLLNSNKKFINDTTVRKLQANSQFWEQN